MKILLRKISDQQHELTIARDGVHGAQRESVTCETRSMLLHDLVHYAVEAAAGIEGGFWGTLARGRTLAEMNDRTGAALDAAEAAEMAAVEQLAGALHGAAKGMPAADVVAGIHRYAAATDEAVPAWLTESFVAAVQERLRALTGAWRATPHGGTLELTWPPGDAPPIAHARRR
jgi:hypothetical protein